MFDEENQNHFGEKDEVVDNRWNCYEYVFHKLGLDPEEVHAGPYKQQLREKFTFVQSLSEADAIVIWDKKTKWIDHMVFVDRKKYGFTCKGTNLRRTTKNLQTRQI